MSTIRVLSINNYHYVRGGAERIFIEQNQLLRSAGHEVAEFCMQHTHNRPSDWDPFFISNLEYDTNDSTLAKFSKAKRVVWNRESSYKITEIINLFSPSIAHLHNVYHHISSSILPVLKQHGVPIVMTLHDLKLLCPAHSMFRDGAICNKCATGSFWNAVRYRCVKQSRLGSIVAATDNFLSRTIGIVDRYVDLFIVPSQFYLKLFSTYGLPLEKLAYVPNFSTQTDTREEMVFNDRYLFFGRLTREKGIFTLLRAAGLAGVKLAIAGTGPEEGKLKVLARELGVECEFLGHLDEDALSKEIRRCRSVVVPSVAYENAPLAVLEAMKHGKLVLGSRNGGISELITEGTTGFLFDADNDFALADSLSMVKEMSNAKLLSMGSSCKEFASRFSTEQYLNKTTEIYKSLLDAYAS